MKYVITIEEETFEIEVGQQGRIWVNNCPYNVDLQGVDGLPDYSLLVDNRSYEAHIEQMAEDECQVVVAGRPYRAYLQQGRQRSSKGASQPGACATGEVRAPLPGLLVNVPVTVGQHVIQGDVVAVVESMKMNLELQAPSSGVIEELHGMPGAEVCQGQVLAVISPEQPAAD